MCKSRGRLIYTTLTGSRAYGDWSRESDWDFKYVYVPPKEVVLGTNPRAAKNKHLIHGRIDVVFWDIRHLFELASKGNIDALEIIFHQPGYHVSEQPIKQVRGDQDVRLVQKCMMLGPGVNFWKEYVYPERHKFLSKQVRRACLNMSAECNKVVLTTDDINKARKLLARSFKFLFQGIRAMEQGELPVALGEKERGILRSIRYDEDISIRELVNHRRQFALRLEEMETDLPDRVDKEVVNALCVDILSDIIQ